MEVPKFRFSWRRLLLLLLLVLLMLWVISRFTDFRNLAQTLATARWGWVAVAAVLHLGYFVMNARLYVFGFGVVSVAARLREMVPVMFAAYFVNVVAPSGGTAGAALFIDDAVGRGESGGRAAVGTILVLLADLATLIPFVVYSLVFLKLENRLRFYDTLGSAVFVAFILLLSGAIAVSRFKPGLLQAVLGRLQGAVNRVGARFHHPNLLEPGWASETALEFQEAAKGIGRRPKALGLALAWATLMHAVNLAGLYFLFLAFEQPVSLGTLTAGFSMGIIFWVVTVVPSGLAAVEGIMALVFTATGIPSGKAAAVVLAFRGLNFWMPLAVGFFLLRNVRTFRRRRPAAAGKSGLGRGHAPTGSRGPGRGPS